MPENTPSSNGDMPNAEPVKTPPPLPPRPQPAQFPEGFWNRVEYLLRYPDEILESLRRDHDLWRLSLTFLVISAVMSAIYGAGMGASNLLQGSRHSLSDECMMIGVAAVKVPMLYLLTLLIVLPPIYVSNAFLGLRFSFRQIVGFFMAATAVSTTVLASLFTVAVFFALTSTSYHFVKLLHVVFFAYAGIVGIAYLMRCFATVAAAAGRKVNKNLFLVWLLLYMFVGTQLAWVMRPFVGNPNEEFRLFRERKGNFYESVIISVKESLSD